MTTNISTSEKSLSSLIRADKLSTLLQISTALMREKDINRLLKLIIERASLILEAERSSIFLMDYETNELYSRVAILKETSEIRFPSDKGIAGYAVKNSTVVNIPDAYNDSRFNPEIDRQTGFHTRSILCAPMLNHKNETVGVLQVLNKRQGVFTAEDELLIMALASLAAVAVENTQLYQEQELTLSSFLKTMGSAIDARDPVTAGHSERVARYALNMGKALGFTESELKILDYAAALHDVGKIGVPDRILLKPGKLSPEEFEEMKRHATRTKEILDNMFFARELREIPHIASSHHEKLNGSGYPLSLKGEQMTRSARILAIADVYDALVSQDRPYKKPLSHQEAMTILEQGRDTLFDGNLLDLFRDKKLYVIERRKYQRFNLKIPFDYALKSHHLQKLLRTSTINISAAGLLFSDDKPYPLGTEFIVSMKCSDKEYLIRAKTIRTEARFSQKIYYIAFAFSGLSDSAQAELSKGLLQMYERAKEHP